MCVRAEVAELADAHGSGPCGSNTLWVRLPSSALQKMSHRTKLCGGSSFSYLSMPVSIFHHAIPRIFPISRIIPKIQLVNTPNKITGPAMVKILHPIPNTCPSALYSIAGATTEFAKPVIGTSAPAPPHFTIFG